MQKNIFCTKESEKLGKKIKISNVFPIYIKNPSNLELEYLKRENYKKIFSIISIFPNLTYLFETKFKIRKCCNEMGYKVSINEIQDLYDYRSLIVHGNFKKINDKTEKITNRQWYFEYVKNSEFDGIAHYHDNSDKEDLIFCRLFEIFNVVFRLYCEKKEAMKILKGLADKELIEMFCFGGDL